MSGVLAISEALKSGSSALTTINLSDNNLTIRGKNTSSIIAIADALNYDPCVPRRRMWSCRSSRNNAHCQSTTGGC